MSEVKVISNIRDAGELEKTIKAWLKDGWTLHSFHPVSSSGFIDVYFVAVFIK